MAEDDDYSTLQNPDSQYTDVKDPASPYDAKGQKPAKPPAPKLKTPTSGEVTILARFLWEPAIDGTTEIALLLGGKWHPGYEDYVEITGVTMKTSPGDFIALLGATVEYKPRSIKRLNFFTHANKTLIGIEGFMDPTNVFFRSSVDASEIAGHAASGLSFTVGKQNFSLDDVRGRFTEDAIFVLYGCDIAFDPTSLLTAWKDLFQVTTIGFKNKTVFCPPAQAIGGKDFKRKGEKIGVMNSGFKCDTDSTRDWRSLINDPNAVKVPK